MTNYFSKIKYVYNDVTEQLDTLEPIVVLEKSEEKTNYTPYFSTTILDKPISITSGYDIIPVDDKYAYPHIVKYLNSEIITIDSALELSEFHDVGLIHVPGSRTKLVNDLLGADYVPTFSINVIPYIKYTGTVTKVQIDSSYYNYKIEGLIPDYKTELGVDLITFKNLGSNLSNYNSKVSYLTTRDYTPTRRYKTLIDIFSIDNIDSIVEYKIDSNTVTTKFLIDNNIHYTTVEITEAESRDQRKTAKQFYDYTVAREFKQLNELIHDSVIVYDIYDNKHLAHLYNYELGFEFNDVTVIDNVPETKLITSKDFFNQYEVINVDKLKETYRGIKQSDGKSEYVYVDKTAVEISSYDKSFFIENEIDIIKTIVKLRGIDYLLNFSTVKVLTEKVYPVLKKEGEGLFVQTATKFVETDDYVVVDGTNVQLDLESIKKGDLSETWTYRSNFTKTVNRYFDVSYTVVGDLDYKHLDESIKSKVRSAGYYKTIDLQAYRKSISRVSVQGDAVSLKTYTNTLPETSYAVYENERDFVLNSDYFYTILRNKPKSVEYNSKVYYKDYSKLPYEEFKDRITSTFVRTSDDILKYSKPDERDSYKLDVSLWHKFDTPLDSRGVYKTERTIIRVPIKDDRLPRFHFTRDLVALYPEPRIFVKAWENNVEKRIIAGYDDTREKFKRIYTPRYESTLSYLKFDDLDRRVKIEEYDSHVYERRSDLKELAKYDIKQVVSDTREHSQVNLSLYTIEALRHAERHHETVDRVKLDKDKVYETELSYSRTTKYDRHFQFVYTEAKKLDKYNLYSFKLTYGSKYSVDERNKISTESVYKKPYTPDLGKLLRRKDIELRNHDIKSKIYKGKSVPKTKHHVNLFRPIKTERIYTASDYFEYIDKHSIEHKKFITTESLYKIDMYRDIEDIFSITLLDKPGRVYRAVDLETKVLDLKNIKLSGIQVFEGIEKPYKTKLSIELSDKHEEISRLVPIESSIYTRLPISSAKKYEVVLRADKYPQYIKETDERGGHTLEDSEARVEGRLFTSKPGFTQTEKTKTELVPNTYPVYVKPRTEIELSHYNVSINSILDYPTPLAKKYIFSYDVVQRDILLEYPKLLSSKDTFSYDVVQRDILLEYPKLLSSKDTFSYDVVQRDFIVDYKPSESDKSIFSYTISARDIPEFNKDLEYGFTYEYDINGRIDSKIFGKSDIWNGIKPTVLEGLFSTDSDVLYKPSNSEKTRHPFYTVERAIPEYNRYNLSASTLTYDIPEKVNGVYVGRYAFDEAKLLYREYLAVEPGYKFRRTKVEYLSFYDIPEKIEGTIYTGSLYAGITDSTIVSFSITTDLKYINSTNLKEESLNYSQRERVQGDKLYSKSLQDYTAKYDSAYTKEQLHYPKLKLEATPLPQHFGDYSKEIKPTYARNDVVGLYDYIPSIEGKLVYNTPRYAKEHIQALALPNSYPSVDRLVYPEPRYAKEHIQALAYPFSFSSVEMLVYPEPRYAKEHIQALTLPYSFSSTERLVYPELSVQKLDLTPKLNDYNLALEVTFGNIYLPEATYHERLYYTSTDSFRYTKTDERTTRGSIALDKPDYGHYQACARVKFDQTDLSTPRYSKRTDLGARFYDVVVDKERVEQYLIKALEEFKTYDVVTEVLRYKKSFEYTDRNYPTITRDYSRQYLIKALEGAVVDYSSDTIYRENNYIDKYSSNQYGVVVAKERVEQYLIKALEEFKTEEQYEYILRYNNYLENANKVLGSTRVRREYTSPYLKTATSLLSLPQETSTEGVVLNYNRGLNSLEKASRRFYTDTTAVRYVNREEKKVTEDLTVLRFPNESLFRPYSRIELYTPELDATEFGIHRYENLYRGAREVNETSEFTITDDLFARRQRTFDVIENLESATLYSEPSLEQIKYNRPEQRGTFQLKSSISVERLHYNGFVKQYESELNLSSYRVQGAPYKNKPVYENSSTYTFRSFEGAERPSYYKFLRDVYSASYSVEFAVENVFESRYLSDVTAIRFNSRAEIEDLYYKTYLHDVTSIRLNSNAEIERPYIKTYLSDVTALLFNSNAEIERPYIKTYLHNVSTHTINEQAEQGKLYNTYSLNRHDLTPDISSVVTVTESKRKYLFDVENIAVTYDVDAKVSRFYPTYVFDRETVEPRDYDKTVQTKPYIISSYLFDKFNVSPLFDIDNASVISSDGVYLDEYRYLADVEPVYNVPQAAVARRPIYLVNDWKYRTVVDYVPQELFELRADKPRYNYIEKSISIDVTQVQPTQFRYPKSEALYLEALEQFKPAPETFRYENYVNKYSVTLDSVKFGQERRDNYLRTAEVRFEDISLDTFKYSNYIKGDVVKLDVAEAKSLPTTYLRSVSAPVDYSTYGQLRYNNNLEKYTVTSDITTTDVYRSKYLPRAEVPFVSFSDVLLRYENNLSKYTTSIDFSTTEGFRSKYLPRASVPFLVSSYEGLRYNNNLEKYTVTSDIVTTDVYRSKYLSRVIVPDLFDTSKEFRYNNNLEKYTVTSDITTTDVYRSKYLSRVDVPAEYELSLEFRYENNLEKYTVTSDIATTDGYRSKYLSRAIATINETVDIAPSEFRYDNKIELRALTLDVSTGKPSFDTYLRNSNVVFITNSDVELRYNNNLSKYKLDNNVTLAVVPSKGTYRTLEFSQSIEQSANVEVRYTKTETRAVSSDVQVSARPVGKHYLNDVTVESIINSEAIAPRMEKMYTKPVYSVPSIDIDVTEEVNYSTYARAIVDGFVPSDYDATKRFTYDNYLRQKEVVDVYVEFTESPSLKRVYESSRKERQTKFITSAPLDVVRETRIHSNVYRFESDIRAKEFHNDEDYRITVQDNLREINLAQPKRRLIMMEDRHDYVTPREHERHDDLRLDALRRPFQFQDKHFAAEQGIPYKGSFKFTDIEGYFTIRGPVQYNRFGSEASVYVCDSDVHSMAWEKDIDAERNIRNYNILQKDSAYAYKREDMKVVVARDLGMSDMGRTIGRQIDQYYNEIKKPLKYQTVEDTVYYSPDHYYPLAVSNNMTIRGPMKPSDRYIPQEIVKQDFNEADVFVYNHERPDRISLFSDRFFLQ